MCIHIHIYIYIYMYSKSVLSPATSEPLLEIASRSGTRRAVEVRCSQMFMVRRLTEHHEEYQVCDDDNRRR